MGQTKMKKAPAYRFLIFILATLAYITMFWSVQLLTSYMQEIKPFLNITDGQFGILVSACTFTMAIFSFLGGPLYMKYGAKKTILLGLALQIVAGVLALLFANSYMVVFIIRIIQGIGSGLTQVCAISAAMVWFPSNERATAQGITMAFYGIAVLVPTLLASATGSMGLDWRTGYALQLIIGCGITAVLYMALYKDINVKYPGCNSMDEVIGISVAAVEENTEQNVIFFKPQNYSECVKNIPFWLIAVSTFFTAWTSLGLSYVIPLLLPELGLSAAEVTQVTSTTFLGAIVMTPFGGPISEKLFKSRKTPWCMVCFGLLAILLLLVPVLVRTNVPLIVLSIVLFLAFGFALAYSGPLWTIPGLVFDPKFVAAGSGLVAFISSLGPVVATPVMGTVSDMAGTAMSGVYVVVLVQIILILLSVVLLKKYKI